MGKTAYSRNPNTAKGRNSLMQSPEHLEKTLESIIRIPTKQPKPSRV